MSLEAELALAAADARAVAGHIPTDRVVEWWSELMDEVDDSRSEGAAALAVIAWRADLRERFPFLKRKLDVA